MITLRQYNYMDIRMREREKEGSFESRLSRLYIDGTSSRPLTADDYEFRFVYSFFFLLFSRGPMTHKIYISTVLTHSLPLRLFLRLSVSLEMALNSTQHLSAASSHLYNPAW